MDHERSAETSRVTHGQDSSPPCSTCPQQHLQQYWDTPEKKHRKKAGHQDCCTKESNPYEQRQCSTLLCLQRAPKPKCDSSSFLLGTSHKPKKESLTIYNNPHGPGQVFLEHFFSYVKWIFEYLSCLRSYSMID